MLIQLCALVAILVTPSLGYDKFWYPLRQAHEIENMSADQFSLAVREGKMMVVHFTVPNTDDPEAQEMDWINDQMLQMAAQSLRSRNVTFGRINMVDNQNLTEQAGVKEADTILVINKSHKHTYKGHRSVQGLLSFINRVQAPVVTVIENKIQKKVFDLIPCTKVIGYFQTWPTNEEMIAFEAAAKAHFPNIPFSAVVTQEMAFQMKFTNLGEIQIVRPFEKTHVILQQNPATTADITAFLESEGRPILRKVTLEDLHDVWGKAGKDRIVAFIRENSADGKIMSKTFKNMAKYGMLRNATDRTILLIDPDNFPVLVDHWQTTFNLNLSMPHLGLLNVTTVTASWANLDGFSTMNTTDQIAIVTLWLEGVTSGKVRVDGVVPVPTQAELETLAREATEMAAKAMEAAKRASDAAEAAGTALNADSPPKEPMTQPKESNPAKQEEAKEEQEI